MRATILILLLASACGAHTYEAQEAEVVAERPTGCSESEPYNWSAESYRLHYDLGGNYFGKCGEWYVGEGWHEKWCFWVDSCGWQFIEEYWEQENWGQDQ